MPEPLIDTPTAPPAEVIPVGLATRILQIVGAAFAVVAGVTAVLDGDHSSETITLVILSALSFFILAGGRYAQAVVKQLSSFWGVTPGA